MNHTIDPSATHGLSGISHPPTAQESSRQGWNHRQNVTLRRASEITLWLTAGVVLGLGMLAAISPLAAGEQLRVAAALAAGFGVVHLWLIADQTSRLAMLGSAIAGSSILLLALNALPAHPAFISAAYALGAVASFAGTERANPMLLISGAGLAVLALLGP